MVHKLNYLNIPENIATAYGKKKGTTSIILAGVHGDEKCGVDVLEKTLESVSIESGTVMYGYGNPKAIMLDKRFTEQNLNRLFYEGNCNEEIKKTYEFDRAEFLKTYFNKADALLDIHASTTEQSTPFVICESNGFDIAKKLPFPKIVSGFDACQPGGTDYYMNCIGKIGICIECGYHKDFLSRKIAQDSIKAFLKARGHIKGDATRCNPEYKRVFRNYRANSNIFTLSKKFADFEILQKGDIVGDDGGVPFRSPKKCFILFAKNGTTINDEVFLLGEDQ